MRLMSDPRVSRVMGDPRVMNVAMKAVGLGGTIKAELDRASRFAAGLFGLATQEEVSALRSTVQSLEDNLTAIEAKGRPRRARLRRVSRPPNPAAARGGSMIWGLRPQRGSTMSSRPKLGLGSDGAPGRRNARRSAGQAGAARRSRARSTSWYGATSATLFALCLRYVRDADEAADLVQRSFVRAMAKLAELRDAGVFRSWLLRIGAHLALNHIRDHARFVGGDVDGELDDWPDAGARGRVGVGARSAWRRPRRRRRCARR